MPVLFCFTPSSLPLWFGRAAAHAYCHCCIFGNLLFDLGAPATKVLVEPIVVVVVVFFFTPLLSLNFTIYPFLYPQTSQVYIQSFHLPVSNHQSFGTKVPMSQSALVPSAAHPFEALKFFHTKDSATAICFPPSQYPQWFSWSNWSICLSTRSRNLPT